MPGAYTHMTMASVLASRRELSRIPDLPPEIISLCGKWGKFCELGAVSPDYAYLKIGSTGAKRWADLMHYEQTDSVIKMATALLQNMPAGEPRSKGLAWLLGYVTHVVMDVTMHPVINAKVGPYELNKREHRVCEMHQDVYVFHKHIGLEVTAAEFLKQGLRACGNQQGQLDPDIKTLWLEALKLSHPIEYARNQPDLDSWHQGFCRLVDNVAEEAGRFIGISRHMGIELGLAYSEIDEIDMQYIVDLPPPDEAVDRSPIHFDDLFERARIRVAEAWGHVARGVLLGSREYETAFANWNLDTGKSDTGDLVAWG